MDKEQLISCSCPLDATLAVIGGKYKIDIIYHLFGRTLRYSEIAKLVTATPKMLAEQLKELEKEINNLDKERVLEIAQKKAEAIKIKADDLVDLAIEKGEMAFSKTAEELREKAIEITKNILEKLEDK